MSDDPIEIMTAWGPVTESARRQAAANMAADRDLRDRVEALLVRQYGEVEGRRQARIRYPEAFGKEVADA